MSYNASLKCTSRIVKVYTNTLRVGYAHDAFTDIILELVDGDTGHSVSIVNNYIQLGANKHYVIFGLLACDADEEGSVIAVDENDNILTETENSLTKQYSALMQTEGITLKFEDSGI